MGNFIKRAGSLLFTVLFAVLAGLRLALDLIGWSTAPDDVEVAVNRLDQFFIWLLGVPGWLVLLCVLVSAMWLMWVSWPRTEGQCRTHEQNSSQANSSRNLESNDEQAHGTISFEQNDVHVRRYPDEFLIRLTYDPQGRVLRNASITIENMYLWIDGAWKELRDDGAMRLNWSYAGNSTEMANRLQEPTIFGFLYYRPEGKLFVATNTEFFSGWNGDLRKEPSKYKVHFRIHSADYTQDICMFFDWFGKPETVFISEAIAE